MELLYPHCAGLDVHKDSVVVCARHMEDGKVRTCVKTFKTTTRRVDGPVGLAFGRGLYAYRHGGHGRLLEAGVAHSF